MKSKHALILVAVFWSSLVGIAQAEPRDEKVTAPETNVIPFLTFLPDRSRLGDLSDRSSNSGSNTAVVFPDRISPSAMPPGGSPASENPADSDRYLASTVVMLDKKLVIFSPELLLFLVVLGGLAVLVWWRKQKRERLNKSIRRLVREIEHEWARYDSYEERVR